MAYSVKIKNFDDYVNLSDALQHDKNIRNNPEKRRAIEKAVNAYEDKHQQPEKAGYKTSQEIRQAHDKHSKELFNKGRREASSNMDIVKDLERRDKVVDVQQEYEKLMDDLKGF